MTATCEEISGLSRSKQGERANPACFVCGSENPKGLHIEFSSEHEEAIAKWRPTVQWESFRGTVHGGVIASVLDEAMSKAIMGRGWSAVTAEMRVRFRGKISPGDELAVSGWIIEKRKRLIRAEAAIYSGGIERAHSWGTFLTQAD